MGNQISNTATDAGAESVDSLDTRFEHFRRNIDELGLSTFVMFMLHKNFDHTDLEILDESEQEIIMTECAPLLEEALQQRSKLQ